MVNSYWNDKNPVAIFQQTQQNLSRTQQKPRWSKMAWVLPSIKAVWFYSKGKFSIWFKGSVYSDSLWKGINWRKNIHTCSVSLKLKVILLLMKFVFDFDLICSSKHFSKMRKICRIIPDFDQICNVGSRRGGFKPIKMVNRVRWGSTQ